MIKKSRWLCGVITVPDGRVLANRMVLPTGPTLWSAMLNIACYGVRDEIMSLRRLTFNKYGIWPNGRDMKHILSHNTPINSSYQHMFNCDIDVYHIKFSEKTKFEIADTIETTAIPFTTLVEDLGSGAWQEQSVTVFNLLDVMCKKEFGI